VHKVSRNNGKKKLGGNFLPSNRACIIFLVRDGIGMPAGDGGRAVL
jgi:hypothetical protein